MRARILTSSASAVLLVAASVVNAKHGLHEHLEVLHKRHHAHHEWARSTAESGEQGIEIRAPTAETATPETADVEKRGGQCVFPTNAGLVAVAPGEENAGWAMSPDQPCKPGNYCPYACPPGEVSMQWDPSATSYTYPESMVGARTGPDGGPAELTSRRMEGSTVMRMAVFRNHSLTNRIARAPSLTLEFKMRLAVSWPSARQYCRGMKPC